MAKKKKKIEVWDFVEPLEGNLVVTEPRAVGEAREQERTEGGLYLPKQAKDLRATFGTVCKVLKAAEDMEEKFPAGTSLLIHEHGGHPIFCAGEVSKAYIVAEGDIMAKVSEEYWKHYD